MNEYNIITHAVQNLMNTFQQIGKQGACTKLIAKLNISDAGIC